MPDAGIACVDGITANREPTLDENSIGIVTAPNPYIGYANATHQASAMGRGVADLVLEQKLLSKERLGEILQPDVLTRPRPILESRMIEGSV